MINEFDDEEGDDLIRNVVQSHNTGEIHDCMFCVCVDVCMVCAWRVRGYVYGM